MDHHLGYSKYDWKNKEEENSRNGHTKKTVKSQFGEMEIGTPRDISGEFEPVIVKKHERVVSHSVEDMIISMYAKGMTTRDINTHMHKIYGVDVSAGMVSAIVDFPAQLVPVIIIPLYCILYLPIQTDFFFF